MDRNAKLQEIAELRARIDQLEAELSAPDTGAAARVHGWQPSGYYTTYYATAGFMLGMFGAVASLLVNIVGAQLTGRFPLELIRVYLTFPLGEKALELKSGPDDGLTLLIGCCLYIGTGMLLGIPFHLVLTRFAADGGLPKRLIVATVLAVAVWLINFYGILSWLQPMLFGGNWIVEEIPIGVAVLTHLVFGWTMALVYPWGLYKPYRLQAESR
ncbi:MAG: hypothetical protein R3C10_26385 [Pirellulales bacterium]